MIAPTPTGYGRSVLLSLIISGCTGDGGDSARGAAADAPDVLVIVVDTLRSDRMSAYGYERQTTPNLEVLAASGVTLEHVSAAYWTLPSVATVMTSLSPFTHDCCEATDSGADQPEYAPMSTVPETLAEVLQAAGYRTELLSRSNIIADGLNFDQGFDHFDRVDVAGSTKAELSSLDSAEILTDEVLIRLGIPSNAPRLTWVHYMDPHTPYEAPEGWLGMWSDAYDSTFDGSQSTLNALVGGKLSYTDEDVGKLLALYDEEIAYFDDQVGRLLSAVGDDTYVVLVGDHGEQFGEHDGWYHRHLWQENLGTPLMFAGPGITPRGPSGAARTIDIAPTIAGLLGVPPSESWQGTDLSELLASDQLPGVWSLSGGTASSALVSPEGLKMISTRHGQALYDLTSDPSESTDVAADRPEDVETMDEKLDELVEAYESVAEELGI